MDRNHFKQRIVGALVLVALGAIVIPFLLDMHEGDEWWGKGNIPKRPANGFVTRVLPLDQWSKQAQSAMTDKSRQLDAVPAHAPATPGAAPGQAPAPSTPGASSGGTPSPSLSSKTASPPAAAGSQTPLAASGTEGWVVQLGSFSNQENADELVARLQKKTYHVFVEKVVQGGQTIYRVRIGPQHQRADAEAIRDKLVRELQLKAMVLHLP